MEWSNNDIRPEEGKRKKRVGTNEKRKKARKRERKKEREGKGGKERKGKKEREREKEKERSGEALTAFEGWMSLRPRDIPGLLLILAHDFQQSGGSVHDMALLVPVHFLIHEEAQEDRVNGDLKDGHEVGGDHVRDEEGHENGEGQRVEVPAVLSEDHSGS